MKLCPSCNTRIPGPEWHCLKCGYAPRVVDGFHMFAPDRAEEEQGFNRKDFSVLAAKEAEHFWFRFRNRLIVWATRRYFPEVKNILEIGCGTGFVLSALESNFPGALLTGSELQTTGLVHSAMRVTRATLIQMDARRIPFESEFDVVGAFDVLEHIDEDELVLKQMHQAVSPGGGIILTVPQHMYLWSVQDAYAQHLRRYDKEELLGKILRAGFEVLYTTSFVSILLPLMMVSRWRNRVRAEQFNPSGELEIPRALSRILEMILRLELVWISAGYRFAVGGSRLVVARKR